MASVVVATAKAAFAVFTGAAAGGGAAGALIQAAAITATSAAINSIALNRQKNDDASERLGTKEISIRSATEHAKMIYGQALAGGVLRYTGVSGSESQYLWRSEIIAGHEVSNIGAIKLDETFIAANEIDWDNNIVDGGFFANYIKVYRLLGTDAQTANIDLAGDFGDITLNHRARGRALLEVRMEWVNASNQIWEQLGPPANVLALVNGQPNIYDPRLDTTPGANPGVYQQYTQNGVLQLAHYLTDPRLGMGEFISVDEIDWEWFGHEADYCESLSPSPGALLGEQRFTSNGILSAGNSYKSNIQALMRGFDGLALQKRGSKWIVRTGKFGYGANLCTNPSFESNITGWSKLSGNGTVTHNASIQVLALTTTAGGMTTAGFALSVTAGTVYSARSMVVSDDNGTAAGQYGLAATYNADGQTSKLASHEVSGYDKEMRIQFKAETTGTVYVSLYINHTTSGLTAEFNDVEIFKVTDVTITDDWLIDDWQLVPDGSKETNYNAVDAIYLSPQEGYKPVEALRQENADYLSRDNGELMPTDLSLEMTNYEYEAQRLAFRYLNKSDYKDVYRLPCSYFAFDILPFDIVNVNIPSISDAEFTARVETVELHDMGEESGIVLIVRAEDVDRYADPDVSDFSTRDDSGEITLAVSEVPDPTAAAVTAVEGGILVTWANPTIPSLFDTIEVYASTTNNRDDANVIARSRTEDHLHVLGSGQTYYYWLRARKGGEQSSFVPDTTTTTLTTTAGNQLATAATTANWSLVNDDDPVNDPKPQGGASGTFTDKPDWYDGTFFIDVSTGDVLRCQDAYTTITDPGGGSVTDPGGGTFTATGTFVKVGSLDVTRLNNVDQVLNTALSILDDGTLVGGSGGQVTIVGLGYNGSLDATDNTITSGPTKPSDATGVDGNLFHHTGEDAWYAKISGSWTKVSDATASNIAAGIVGQGDLAVLDSADWATQVGGTGKPDDNATRNDGPLLSDGFSISSNITADALPINNWQLDRDGLTPITLVSNQSFEFDEAGAYQVNLTLSMSFDAATHSSAIPPSITFQLYTRYASDGVTYAAADNYQYIDMVRPYSTTSTDVVCFGSIALSIVLDAAENSRLQFYFNAVNAADFAVNNCKVDILQLKQVPA